MACCSSLYIARAYGPKAPFCFPNQKAPPKSQKRVFFVFCHKLNYIKHSLLEEKGRILEDFVVFFLFCLDFSAVFVQKSEIPPPAFGETNPSLPRQGKFD